MCVDIGVMNLLGSKILNNTLEIKFDRVFKHIKLVKLELVEENRVETDNLEMKFSKEKDKIMLFIRDTMKFVMLYISMIDNEECSSAYYIKNENEKGSGEMGMDISGISMLLKSTAGDFFSEGNGGSGGGVGKRVCLIKSENIFAEINKKL